MGCASSTVLAQAAPDARTLRGISVPSHHQDLADHFHIVALTSSTYGILKVDPPKALEDDSKDVGEPVKDMLSKFSSLESTAEAAPQSWLEVSSMLENLKPGLANIKSLPPGSGKMLGKFRSQQKEELDAVDIREIMEGLDDDGEPISSNTKVAPLPARKPKPFDNSLPIHTLEELDSCLGNKPKPKSPSTMEARVAHLKGLHDSPGSISSGTKVSESSTPGLAKKTSFASDKRSTKVSQKITDMCNGVPIKQASNADLCLSRSTMEQDDPETKFEGCEQVEPQVKFSPKPASSNVEVRKQKPAPLSPLLSFERICPPGGENSVVVYTTSVRGIRKTYEDCNNVKRALESFGIAIDERDVSMHLEFRNELRQLMEKVVTVPRLFIKGRYIGGAEEVARLNEEGKLAELLEGIPADENTGRLCDGCGGARFVPCMECSGSCKVVDAKEGTGTIRCPYCNENGLIACPICS